MWFQELFGFEEETPEQVRENLVLQGEVLHSNVNGRSFQCGTLEIATLEELRAKAPRPGDFTDAIHIREFVGDVQDLHCIKGSRHALFQAASQFNLLEMVSPQVTPEQGIGRYMYDRTQGPACAIACGAGTAYRNYFVPVNGQLGQTKDEQIDCLDLIGAALGNKELALWKMSNGYVMSNEAGLQHIGKRLNAMGPHGREQVKGKLKIGLQWDTEVTLMGNGQRVSQAYCSALPVAYSHVETNLWEPFARLILEATYEATLYAALINMEMRGSNIVYLTLVGGGAFGNPPAWIIDAITQAFGKFKNVPLDVRIVSYGSSDPMVKSVADGSRSDDV